MRNNKNNITLSLENIISFLTNITTYFTGKAKIITLVLAIIMLSFINITLCFLNSSNISALSYQSNVGVSFTFNPTLSVNISPSNLMIDNLTPGTTSNSNEITISVATNNAYGYSLYASVGNSTYNNTNLNHSDNAGIFSSIAANAYIDSLSVDNTWGYTYSLNNGTSWIPYNGLPLYSNSQNKITMNTEPAQETVDFKIAARAGGTQPSGVYNNVINFAAVATISPITLAEAYESEDKELYHGYYKMQDMTDTICEKTEDINAQLQVIDVRDDKIYWIAKLTDDHCWMTQNLAYSITKDANDNIIPLTSEDTDLNEYGDHNYTSQYGYTKNANDIISWTPLNATIEFNGTAAGGWVRDNTLPASVVKLDDIGIGHESLGDYYNWTASIASNNSSVFNYDTLGNFSRNPKNSICPKGWRLPIISNEPEFVIGTTNEFARLNYLYNGNLLNVDSNLLGAPLYFNKTGYIKDNGHLNMNSTGYYWSSTIGKGNGAYNFHFNSTLVQVSENYNSRFNGFPLRCVAR